MLNYLLVTAILCFSVYLVSGQPSGAPSVDYYLNAGNPLPTSWVWPHNSIGALQPGNTYVLGGRIDNPTLGYGSFNVSFTYSSSCTATSYNSAGPSGNQGWRYVFSQVDTTSELPAAPSPSVATWAGPTSFGTSRALKVSLYMDYFDVCNCITVNWIGFITTDASGYNAHYWNSASEKRSQNNTLEKRCKREDLEERDKLEKRNNLEKRTCGTQAGQVGCAGGWSLFKPAGYPDCLCAWCGQPYAEGETTLPTGYVYDGGDPVTKRTNYYLYWINISQPACRGLATIGSYGNGVSGSVTTSSALGTTYI